MPTVTVFYGIWIPKPTELSIRTPQFYAASMMTFGIRRRLVSGGDLEFIDAHAHACFQ